MSVTENKICLISVIEKLSYRLQNTLYFTTFATILYLAIAQPLKAEQQYTSGDVFANLVYGNQLVDELLAKDKKSLSPLPQSLETDIESMHVYELHVSILHELMSYTLNNGFRPAPIASSQAITYTPTDVYYLSKIITTKLESIYSDKIGINFKIKPPVTSKSPSQVYQQAFELFYRLSALNGQERISPNVLYAQVLRAKHDLQASLLAISKRLDDSDEKVKRQLVTAIYGINTDGSMLAKKQQSMKLSDVLQQTLTVRNKLNQLRKHHNLPIIQKPELNNYPQIRPVDVFLQTQFIIAELNFLKQPWDVHTTTNNAETANDKTPDDVYHQVLHIEYMLDRLIKVLG